MERVVKYKLIKEASKEDPVRVVLTLDNEASLDEMCELFEAYLKASGFIINGHVDIVETEDLLKVSQAW